MLFGGKVILAATEKQGPTVLSDSNPLSDAPVEYGTDWCP